MACIHEGGHASADRASAHSPARWASHPRRPSPNRTSVKGLVRTYRDRRSSLAMRAVRGFRPAWSDDTRTACSGDRAARPASRSARDQAVTGVNPVGHDFRVCARTISSPFTAGARSLRTVIGGRLSPSLDRRLPSGRFLVVRARVEDEAAAAGLQLASRSKKVRRNPQWAFVLAMTYKHSRIL